MVFTIIRNACLEKLILLNECSIQEWGNFRAELSQQFFFVEFVSSPFTSIILRRPLAAPPLLSASICPLGALDNQSYAASILLRVGMGEFSLNVLGLYQGQYSNWLCVSLLK